MEGNKESGVINKSLKDVFGSLRKEDWVDEEDIVKEVNLGDSRKKVMDKGVRKSMETQMGHGDGGNNSVRNVRGKVSTKGGLAVKNGGNKAGTLSVDGDMEVDRELENNDRGMVEGVIIEESDDGLKEGIRLK